MNKSINVSAFIKVMIKKIWIIVLCAIVLGCAGYLQSIFGAKTIGSSATSSIYVSHSKESDNKQNLDLNIQDCIEIIKSRNVLESTIQKLDLDMSVSDLSSKYNVENVTNSRIIKISISDNSREKAVEIVSTIQDIAVKKINEIDQNTEAIVIEDARLSESQTAERSNHTKKGIAIGFLAGIVIVMFAFRKQYITSEA